MATIASLLAWAEEQLKSQNSRMESQILLAHVLQCERAVFYTWPMREISEDLVLQFEALVQRRLKHEPIGYILGHREFWSLPFQVNSATLIPRHETELLVQTVLDLLPNTAQHIVDVGTGCGNIACALAHERSAWQVLGVDISEDALRVAKQNATTLKLNNVSFLQSNWLEKCGDMHFDAVIGNPPYIRANDVHLIHGDLVFEPSIALTPGRTGLEAYQAILAEVTRVLKPGGLVAFEHGFDQGEAVRELLKTVGLREIKTVRDASGNERVTLGWRKKG